MKVAIMQPYIFPYIGYWQLIHAVDKFVILDDVNYIMRGYINRNSVLLGGQPYRFTIPVKKASQNKLIKDTRLSFEEEEKRKFLMTLRNAYRKAPQYEAVMPVMEDIINNPQTGLVGFVQYSMERILKLLQVRTEILVSSQMEKGEGLRAQNRILEICKMLGTDIYVNSCGGRKLYCHADFENMGIGLFFLDTKWERVVYNQGQNEFVNNLSIIDILMFNDIDTIQSFLEQYELNP